MAVEAPGTHSAVTGAIRHASRLTGTNFQYLVATAQVESKFNPAAAAATSSARGLFQFIEQTWLATIKEQGPALGYAQVADSIERAPSGQYVVTDPRLSDRIMKMRNDPTVNAVMAGAYTRANAGKLAGRLGRNPTEGELYVAHFLGSNGASRLISLAEVEAAAHAPTRRFRPRRAPIPSIFYDRGTSAQRRARSIARWPIATRLARNELAAPPATQIAAVQQPQAATPTPTAPRPAFAPDTAVLTDAYAAAARMSEPSRQIADAAPVFHGLFRTSAGREAVAPVVSALWTAPTPVVEAAPQAGTASGAQQVAAKPEPAGGTLSLFQDQAADARALFRGRV